MKIIESKIITKKIKNACIDINYNIDQVLLKLYKKAILNEVGFSKTIMKELIKNSKLAKSLKIPLCQDTGTMVIFVTIGNTIKIKGDFIETAILNGVKQGYQKGYLRKSIVNDPFERKNTKTNLPPIIHYKIVNKEILTIELYAKGAGSENMSALKMLSPSQGKKGVEKFILNTIKKAGANACPPIIVGVGIGSNFEGVALLAKKALLRPLTKKNIDLKLQKMENDLENKINKLGIGPQGLGGKTTAFKVNILTEACHIASLPVAININCHVNRHKKIVF